MKLFTLLSAVIFVTALQAQTEVTIPTGPGNTTQAYYSLANDVQGTVALGDWDLAFEISGFTSTVQVNTMKGLTAFETPEGIADWNAVNAPDEMNWISLNNSETYWSAGALSNGNNLSEPDGFNVGWGTYNLITHTIAGTKVYVIGFPDATFRKLRINSLAGGAYSFTHAALDGTDEQTVSLMKAVHAGKNFGYYSFVGGVLDLEPPTASWDLLFTKYTAIIPAPAPTAYGVAGVLQNKGVDALQVDGVDPASADWNSGPLDSAMNVIGYDWKSFNMETSMYEYPTDRTYFVQDRAGNIWKLIFTAYGGGSNGNMTFTQDMVSAVGVEENYGTRDLVVYPNPTNTGSISIILDRTVRNGQLSILDLTGKLVSTANVTGGMGLVAWPVDVSGLSDGTYVMKLDAEGSAFTTRFVVGL
ncbi:MAG: T9SS type A sorting domain-containing protein [Flavobacteriales bacterium]|nr:T9SS type A sorting domain-containing protein [Flavobacteriales bacterium]MCC6911987.1 T9SS type A sorting domain-containing protein [Flavobacteriales bacterium]